MYKSRFNLFHDDGATTHTTTASMALLHWIFQDMPSSIPEVADVLVPYIGNPVPGPYERLFLVNVIASAERKFGKGPDIQVELLSEDWYEQFQEVDHNFVLKAIKDGNNSVILYEDTCLNILRWLENERAFKLEVCDVR